MDNEKQVFDFMAAAEDTGKRLDDLVKAIPGEIRQTLANEYQKSPWVSALQKVAGEMAATVKHAESAAGKTDAAAENVVNSGNVLLKKVRLAGILACVGTIALPLATWAIAYTNVSDLRRDLLRLEQERDELGAAIEMKIAVGREEVFRQEGEVKKLSAAAKVLHGETGGGIELIDKGDGAWTLTLPANITLERPWKEADGRYVIPYVLSGK